jgi:hypothetical protein
MKTKWRNNQANHEIQPRRKWLFNGWRGGNRKYRQYLPASMAVLTSAAGGGGS